MWVDSLCIEQGGPYMLDQIKSMDLIYTSASLTIIAAAGNNSWAGLPGLREGSRIVQQLTRSVNGMRMIEALPNFRSALRRSKWLTRAWTYQEALFSRMVLVFTDKQVFFRCESHLFCEDTHLDKVSACVTPLGDAATA